MNTWLADPLHHRGLEHHAYDLLDFARRTGDPRGGAYWLGDDGTPDTTRPTYAWITSRMTHVYAIGSLLAIPGMRPIADATLAGLTGRLHDTAHGGWHSAVDGGGNPVEPVKSCYDHAFVLPAASSAAFSASINGVRCATAFFITRADFTTWGRNILPAPNR